MPLCLARSQGGAQRFAAALAAHLRHNTGLQEMELAFSLPPRALSTLGDALPRAGCLRVVSFAGSRLGDAGLMRLLDGLQSCVCLQSLSCARCELTDVGGQALAGLLREHTHAKDYDAWRASLRMYGSVAGGDGGGKATLWRRNSEFIGKPRNSSSSAAPGVPSHGKTVGLLHLDMSGNPRISIHSVAALCAALDPSRYDTRLLALDARDCGLPVEAGDHLADIMRRGALLRIADCRGNAPGLAVVYRDEDSVGDVVHLDRLPGTVASTGRAGGRVTTASDAPRFVQQPPMRFRMWSDHSRPDTSQALGYNTAGSDIAGLLGDDDDLFAAVPSPATWKQRSLLGMHGARIRGDREVIPPPPPPPHVNSQQVLPPPPWLHAHVTAPRPATAAPSQQQRGWGLSNRRTLGKHSQNMNEDVAALSQQLLRALLRLEKLLPDEGDGAGGKQGRSPSPSPLPVRPANLSREQDVVSRSSDDDDLNAGDDGLDGDITSGDEGGAAYEQAAKRVQSDDDLASVSPTLQSGADLSGSTEAGASPQWPTAGDLSAPRKATPEELMRAVAEQLRVLCNLDDGIA